MLPREHVEEVQRPNVRGTGFIKYERQGQRFQMFSFVDLASDEDVAALKGQYFLSIGTDPLSIIWRDLDYFALYGVKYVVVDVTDVRSKWMFSGTGGLNPPSLSSLMVIWHLVPVEVQQ